MTRNALERLHDYITDVIYPSYKMAPNRRGAVYRLDLANLKMLSNFDAEWFLRAVEGNLFTEIHGEFTMARNSARESIFWSGLKSEVPQSKGIAVEPIVTMGAIARLHFEHGWPLDCLGTQPTKWKFDLAAYNTDGEAILCEVKRRPRDVERMCAYFAGSFEPKSLGELKNLSRKLDYLRGSPAGIFWGLAPGQEEHIHVIERGAEPGEFRLHKGSLSDLDYRA